MEFLSEIKSRDDLLGVSLKFKYSLDIGTNNHHLQLLNVAIDRIYKKETPKKYLKFTSELDYIGNIFTQYSSNQLTKSELLEFFPVNDELKDCVFKAIEVRKPQICQYLVKVHNSSNSPLMKSFDWDLKFIIGNSSLASFREQRATLILNCQKGKETETVSLELNRSMIEKMIQELDQHTS